MITKADLEKIPKEVLIAYLLQKNIYPIDIGWMEFQAAQLKVKSLLQKSQDLSNLARKSQSQSEFLRIYQQIEELDKQIDLIQDEQNKRLGVRS